MLALLKRALRAISNFFRDDDDDGTEGGLPWWQVW